MPYDKNDLMVDILPADDQNQMTLQDVFSSEITAIKTAADSHRKVKG